MKFCNQCNGPTVQKALFSSFYDHCDRCDNGTSNTSIFSNIDDFLDTDFVRIMPGNFKMGSPESEFGRSQNETQHLVTITKSFEMQRTQVTQKQWEKIMNNNPSYFKDPYKPVERVSFDDVQIYIQKLNQSQSKHIYRLPTEAEWEYCCRAGTETAYSFGNDLNDISKYAVVDQNETKFTASLLPNDWGIYDMHGNVCEWCQDFYENQYPFCGPYSLVNPKGPSTGSYRVIRGGSCCNFAQYARSACRSFGGSALCLNDIGFRLVRT